MGTLHCSPTIPPHLNSDLELVVQPEELLQVRRVGANHTGRLEALLKWKSLPDYEATWEDVDSINARFPEFHLEDKVIVWGRGNVIPCTKEPKTLQTYVRRKKTDKVKG